MFKSVTILAGLLVVSCWADSQGIYVKDWTWKPDQTRENALVQGAILIRVCWDIPNTLVIPGNRSVSYWKEKVELHINEAWNGYAGIRIVFDPNNGSTFCDATIGHGDKKYLTSGDPNYEAGKNKPWRPYSAIGNIARNFERVGKKAMILCWTYKNYSPGVIGKSKLVNGSLVSIDYDPDYHEKAILGQAVHEFGHLLGLVHEQNQPDKPASCTAVLDQKGDYTPITLYDPKSIMNYCNPDYKGAVQVTPSCGDISSLRYMYYLPSSLQTKDPDCFLHCESGIDDNLVKTGAALAACDPIPDRIIGTLSNTPRRLEYPGEPDGPTPPIPPNPPVPPGPENGLMARVSSTVTSTMDDSWDLSFDIANPGEIYSKRLRVYRIDGMIFTEDGKWVADKVLWDHSIISVDYTPITIRVPKGDPGFERVEPSKIRWKVVPAYGGFKPKRVSFGDYTVYTVYYTYYTCASDNCQAKGEATINIKPIPKSIEFFNAIDSKTVVHRKKMTLIPRRNAGALVALDPFYMDTYEVTQLDYMSIMAEYPFKWPGDTQLPAEGVTQYDAILYCNKRSVLEGLSPAYSYGTPVFNSVGGCTQLPNLSVDMKKNGYRLPTVAEAIYAFKGNTVTNYPWGNFDAPDADQYGWHNGNSSKTHPVGQKLPNQWGLYDTFGNVMEWVWGVECAGGTAYNDWATTADGPYSTRAKGCIGAASSAPFIGFRAVRKAPGLLPMVVPLLLSD